MDVPARFRPRVTIAIPVYNGANYLDQAIDSALAQTYDDVEVIVVNDGSTDDGATAAVARRYEGRIRYIEQPNGGVGAAMNTAVANMTGDVFTWLSHDDIHLPEKVSAQVEYYNKIGKRDAILFSDFYLLNDDGEVWHETKLPYAQFMKTPALALLNGCINGCTLFIPLQILREFGPFDESLRFVQDYDLWNRVLSKYEFFLQQRPLVRYRIHSGQDTHKPGAVIEGDALWIRMLESRSEIERAQLFGSTKRYFSEMQNFLAKTPYKKAAAYARDRIDTIVCKALVSVIIPFYNEIECVIKAAHSVLNQTHDHLELILVNDGSTEDIAPLEELVVTDSRVRLVHQANAGPGAARNRGLGLAAGDYIAFLDADDLFLPHKLQWQLGAMQAEGMVFSHSSFYVSFPQYFDTFATIPTGSFTGNLYPQIVGGCPIATPTVMVHRSVLSGGFQFMADTRVGEDLLAWIWVAQRHSVLGIKEPLTIVEWSHTTAGLRIDKSLEAVTFMLNHVRRDPLLSRCAAEIRQLEAAIDHFHDLEKTAEEFLFQDLDVRHLIRRVVDAAFGEGASGRIISSYKSKSRKYKFLFVCLPYSIHSWKWISMLDPNDIEIHVYPSVLANNLHTSFRNVTYWPLPGLNIPDHVKRLRLAGDPNQAPISTRTDLARYLAGIIDAQQYDLVHSLEFQHAAYLMQEARAFLTVPCPKWIATNYGADIAHFAKQPEHERQIRNVLRSCDIYWSECQRDVGLARELGFSGPALPVLPNSGGLDLARIAGMRSPGRTSDRRVIAVKGYQHFAGRALTALQALVLCRESLTGYVIKIFSPFPEVVAEATKLKDNGTLNVVCLPEWSPHEDILALHGSARISLSVSIADGISTSLLEAMAMGSFPVQTSSACADEWIQDGVSGFIVEPHDIPGMAEKIRWALVRDDLVNHAAEINFKHICEKADRQRIQTRVNQIYEGVLSQ